MHIERILIVEDHLITAEFMKKVVATSLSPHRIDSAHTYKKALRLISTEDYDLALVDIGLPDGNGLDIIELLSSKENTFTVVTTIFDSDEYVFDALKVGASGYLVKGHNEDEMKEYLLGILKGKPPLSPSIAMSILDYFHRSPKRGERIQSNSEHSASEKHNSLSELENKPLKQKIFASLTKRETEVLQLIAKGCHVKNVSEMLDISPATVSSHIKKTYRKLNIHNRAEATAAAISLDLYRP